MNKLKDECNRIKKKYLEKKQIISDLVKKLKEQYKINGNLQNHNNELNNKIKELESKNNDDPNQHQNIIFFQ